MVLALMTHSPEKDFYATLPGKRMASRALYFNSRGELLIVSPVYREGWLIPGGVVERNESPYQACLREVKEELGIETARIVFHDRNHLR